MSEDARASLLWPFDETALEEEKKEQIVESQPVFQKSSRQNLVVQENQQQA